MLGVGRGGGGGGGGCNLKVPDKVVELRSSEILKANL